MPKYIIDYFTFNVIVTKKRGKFTSISIMVFFSFQIFFFGRKKRNSASLRGGVTDFFPSLSFFYEKIMRGEGGEEGVMNFHIVM